MVKRVGQYELKTILGKGTFGTVYIGKHMPSKNKVAVKVIQKEGLKPELLLRLEQEIQCQRSVSSENIVRLIDVQKTENNFYLILEYCKGGDLGKYLKENGPVSEAIAQRWLQQIVEGFKALQKKSIIHRDLKTQNILLSEYGPSAVLKVADFGLSRFIEEDLAKTWVGTPLYMAPEIFNCEEYGSKADIWSLGIVFYEMLTGELPIKVYRRDQIPAAQKNLKAFPLGISENCKDLLQKLLEYDQNKRISFQDLFTHPFIIGKEVDKDSENMSEEFEEDFVLLERDESIHEMVVLKKDQHPILNVPEVIESIQKKIELSIVLEKISEKLNTNHKKLHSYAVSIESCIALENGVNEIKEIIAKYQLQQGFFPKLFEGFEKLKSFFRESLKKAEEFDKSIIENKQENCEKVNIAEFLKQYAVNLCNKAAKDEYLSDFDSSKSNYEEAINILNHLRKKCAEKSKSDMQLENFIRVTQNRIKNVTIRKIS